MNRVFKMESYILEIMNIKAREEFRKVLKGSNFMTPNLIDFYFINGGAVELSSGKFLDTNIVGVTVVKDNKIDNELSKTFSSQEEAEEYIETLK